MQTRFPLDTQEAVLHLDRAGLATRARLAAESVARGRTAVLVAGSRESFQALQGLAVLFTPELSAEPVPPDTPAWARSVISLPPRTPSAQRSFRLGVTPGVPLRAFSGRTPYRCCERRLSPCQVSIPGLLSEEHSRDSKGR